MFFSKYLHLFRAICGNILVIIRHDSNRINAVLPQGFCIRYQPRDDRFNIGAMITDETD